MNGSQPSGSSYLRNTWKCCLEMQITGPHPRSTTLRILGGEARNLYF